MAVMCTALQNTHFLFLVLFFLIAAVIRFENSVQHHIGVCMGDCRSFFLVGATGGGKLEKNEMVGACGAYGGGERCAQGSVGETGGKETIGETQNRWEDNIKLDLQEMGGSYGDWMELAQDRDRWRALVSTVMNLRVP